MFCTSTSEHCVFKRLRKVHRIVSAQRKCHSLRGVRGQFPAKRKRHKAGAMVAQDLKRARRKWLSVRLATAPSAIVVLCTASSVLRGFRGGTSTIFNDPLPLRAL